VTIILGGDSLIHKENKDPETNRGFAATPRSTVRVRQHCSGLQKDFRVLGAIFVNFN
jgi:hypothetical protein